MIRLRRSVPRGSTLFSRDVSLGHGEGSSGAASLLVCPPSLTQFQKILLFHSRFMTGRRLLVSSWELRVHSGNTKLSLSAQLGTLEKSNPMQDLITSRALKTFQETSELWCRSCMKGLTGTSARHCQLLLRLDGRNDHLCFSGRPEHACLVFLYMSSTLYLLTPLLYESRRKPT